MINYRAHSVEELATDEMFRRWIIDPTPEISLFWKQWTQENPDRVDVVNLAKELVLAVHEIHKDELTDEMIDQDIKEISRIAATRTERKSLRFGQFYSVWRAAAVLLVVAGLAWVYLSPKKTPLLLVNGKKQVHAAEEMLVRTNKTQQELTVLLSDNSVATLTKGSTIRFPKKFGAGERRVYLTGDAFFDVAKNPDQPFLVFTNETVTKVLGTSFRVKAFDEESTVMVIVKTGRVSVYPKNDYETTEGKITKENKGVVPDPNQQAVFIRKENRLEKGKVVRTEMLSESLQQKDQFFDEKPVAEVFESLEKSYGIVIVYNTESLANCVISAQFDDENLKQRLNAVCQAIGATYDMVDGQIMINSKGCI